MRITLHGSLVSQEAHTVMGARDPGLGDFVVRLEAWWKQGRQELSKKGEEGAGGPCHVSAVRQDGLTEKDEVITTEP